MPHIIPFKKKRLSSFTGCWICVSTQRRFKEPCRYEESYTPNGDNLLRQDLTSVEEAEALDRLMKEESYTQEQLGVIIGKARTTVNEILSLNRLPQEIRDECRSNPAVTRKALVKK